LPIHATQSMRGCTASLGFLGPTGAVRPSLGDELAAAPLRHGEILPDPDFSLLRAPRPYLVGVRPHREGGVCLKLDDELIPSRHGSKFLIHNYGHGGAGITLSFGCASVVADHLHSARQKLHRPSLP